MSELTKHIEVDGSGRVDFESFFNACQKSKLEQRMANIRSRNNNDSQIDMGGKLKDGQVPSAFGDLGKS